MPKALITGITGQDGIHLTKLLRDKGYSIYGMTSSESLGAKVRFQSLFPEIHLLEGDLRDQQSILNIIDSTEPNEIYNLGSISSVSRSFEEESLTHDVNGRGPLRIIEALISLGLSTTTKLYQASSSEMFGQSDRFPQNEQTPFNPLSPYASSKVFAHENCAQTREELGMSISCGILFNHESEYRTGDFVSRKICKGVARIALGLEKKIVLGSLHPERDWGYAGDYVEAMWLMLQQDNPGDFVISTGKSNSILQFLKTALEVLGIEGDAEGFVEVEQGLIRPMEINKSVGDSSKARMELGWVPKTSFIELVELLVMKELEELEKNQIDC